MEANVIRMALSAEYLRNSDPAADPTKLLQCVLAAADPNLLAQQVRYSRCIVRTLETILKQCENNIKIHKITIAISTPFWTIQDIQGDLA